MQTKRNIEEAGNVLLCVLGVILVVSFLGATVLQNSTTRLNVSTNQVRAWKDAHSAAESGGDIGLAEIRKTLFDPLASVGSGGRVVSNRKWLHQGNCHPRNYTPSEDRRRERLFQCRRSLYLRRKSKRKYLVSYSEQRNRAPPGSAPNGDG